MPYLLIKDFTAGWDTRKSAFTAPAGSLRRLTNAHITAGGEIEKRKAFTPFAEVPATSVGLHAAPGGLVVFGSAEPPAEGTLPAPSTATALERILDAENFGPAEYAIGQFSDGSVGHFYAGERVAAWDTMMAEAGSLADVVRLLAARATEAGPFTATTGKDALGRPTLRIVGHIPEQPFSCIFRRISTTSEVYEHPPTITPSPNPGSVATGSGKIPLAGGGLEQMTEVLVRREDGATTGIMYAIEPRPLPTAAELPAFVAALVAELNVDNPYYQFTVSGAPDGTITYTAKDYLGGKAETDLWNGWSVWLGLSGKDPVDNRPLAYHTRLLLLSGGAKATNPGQPYIVDYHTLFQFQPTATYQLELEGVVHEVKPGPQLAGRAIHAHGGKLYSVAGTLLSSSGFNNDEASPDYRAPDPTRWRNSPNTLGAALIDLSTESSGTDSLVALGDYQDQLVVMGRSSTQLWAVAADPDQNQRLQTLRSVGTRAPRSLVGYGDVDLFFLADTGVRSLRARQTTGLAATEDIGSPIDEDMHRYMATLSEEEIAQAVGALDPSSGRYWLALGKRIYVFSHFPASRVAAWAYYDLPASVEAMAVFDGQVYARSGTTIWHYGGLSGSDYDASRVEVVLPFLDADKPATEKQFHSLDLGVEGTWEVYVGLDPTRPDFYTQAFTVTGATYGQRLSMPISGVSTHISLKFVNKEPGYARLSNVAIHYDDGEAK